MSTEIFSSLPSPQWTWDLTQSSNSTILPLGQIRFTYGKTKANKFFLSCRQTLEDIPDAIPKYRFGLLLQPRSMLILKDELYHNYLHGIDEVSEDDVDDSVRNLSRAGVKVGQKIQRKTRVSLTIRNVPRTSKAKMLLSARKKLERNYQRQ